MSIDEPNFVVLLCEYNMSDNTKSLVGTGLTQFIYTVYPWAILHNMLKQSIALKSCPMINNNCLSICTNICNEQKKEF